MKWSDKEYQRQVARVMGWGFADLIIILLFLAAWLVEDDVLYVTVAIVSAPLLIVEIRDIVTLFRMQNEDPTRRRRKRKNGAT